MHFRLFGRLAVVRAGEELQLGSTKQRAVLAALLLHSGSVVSTDALIDWAWPEGDAPGSPITSIRSYVSNLRRILGDGEATIVSQAPGYVIELGPDATDVAAFGRQWERAAAADNPAEEARHLDAALALASQPLLPEFAYHDVAEIEARTAAERVLAVRERRIELAFELGDHSDFVAELERLVADHPLRENATGLLMRALYLSGRQAESLDAYARLRATLAEELGLDPTAALQELEGQILRQDPTLRPTQTGESTAAAGSVPSAVTPVAVPRVPRAQALVGRVGALGDLQALVGKRRLVTLVGSGGIGKTSLALAVGEFSAEQFVDGVAVVELAQVADRDGVLEATAEAIGAREQLDLTLLDSIVNFLEERELLVILDNCEHVIDPVRELVRAIATADGPTIIATSRESLRVPGEQLFPVEPLDPRTHGVELFVRRAQERDPGFMLDETTSNDVEQICSRLDGVPLAIELAAARVRVLGSAELLAGLTDRFRVLPRGDRRGRSESLRDVAQWSYDLLDEPSAQLFRQLSVFAGGFTLEAAAAVGAETPAADIFDILDLLTKLVDSSMVTSRTRDGRVRFSMLETLREFGLEQLVDQSQVEAVTDRHATFFANLVQQRSATLLTCKEPEVWTQLTEEWANIRQAFEHKQISAYDEAVDLVLALVWFSVFASRLETFGWVDELLEENAANGHPREVALIGSSAVGGYMRLDADAIATAERGLAVDGTDPGGYNRAALAAVYLNNVFAASDSDQLTQDWLAHVEPDDPADMLWAYGMRLFHLGSFEPGRDTSDLLAVLVQVASTSGSPSAEALRRWAEGIHLASMGKDLSESLAAWEAGLDAARSLSDDHLMVGLIEGLILYFTSPTGELQAVAAQCRDAILSATNQDHLAAQSHLFGVAAVVLTRAEQPEQGAKLLGAMIGNGLRPRPLATHTVAKALGDRYEDAVRAGSDLALRDAGRLAIEAIDALVRR